MAKEIAERVGTQGWEQFLATKQEMLYQFDLAKIYADSHIVKVSHGKVAEATFRKWLSTFLPKKFGVTSGYIVSQNIKLAKLDLPHYDVIIFDQLNSPVLWVEENVDSSDAGKSRAIPAEYVYAVLEVKSNLTEETSKKAMEQMLRLKPLLWDSGEEPSPYNGKLHSLFFTAAVYFELQKTNEFKEKMLTNFIVDLDFPFYGGVVLKGEGRNINDTASIKLLHSETPISSSIGKDKESLLSGGAPLSGSIEMTSTNHIGTMLMWTQANFSQFAFDLIAKLEGNYRPGYSSSFYGLNWLNPERDKK